jgi:hypothetical protein
VGFEQQEEEEQEDLAAQEVQAHEEDVEELLECSDHRPSAFE